jgi:HJR/Mrr/RecB family endonuclease
MRVRAVVSKLLSLRGMPFLSPSRAALALLLFVGGASSSQALQLGETQAQIVARHGAPAVEDHGRQLAMYYWTGWSARLEFRGGVVEKLIYKKSDYVTPADIASLLQANGGANRWRETTPQGAETRLWSRDDGAAASCDAVHATGMSFQSAQAVISTLQNLAEPKTAPSPGVQPAAATPPPAPQFFPDPLAVQAKPDPKLSEISIPAATPEPARAPPVKVAAPPVTAAVEPSPIRPAEHPAPKADLPASIDPPTQTESPAASASSAPEPSRKTPAPPAAESDGFGRILALGCLIFGIGGALILLYKSLPRRRSRSSSFPGDVSQPARGAGLDALRWEQVELLVGEIHRRMGYTAELSAGLGSDDDIDLTLRRDNETVLVQCRHWRTLRVAEREMREFYSAMASSAAPRGIFVTMGGVTRGARDFAEDKGIDLIDRKTLEERIAGISHPGENLCVISEWLEEFASHSRIFDPECPVCREAMTLRRHPAGHSAFWGCRSYPRCPGKREPRRDLLDLISSRQKSSVAPAA